MPADILDGLGWIYLVDEKGFVLNSSLGSRPSGACDGSDYVRPQISGYE